MPPRSPRPTRPSGASPGLLALEGGLVLTRVAPRQPPPRRRRPRLHHRRHRLGRDPDRSVLRGPDGRADPSDGRQLPDRALRARVRASPCARPRRHSARRAAARARRLARRAAGGGRDPGHLGDRHPRADARPPQRRRAPRDDRAGRGRGGRDAVERARRSPTWESVDHVAAVATSRAVPRSRPTGSGARGRCSSTTASSARSSPRSPAAGSRSSAFRRMRPRPTSPRTGPTSSSSRPAPATRRGWRPRSTTVRELAATAAGGGTPILGICLGHQLLGLAAGAETRRLAVGHHGGNHAVLEAATGRVDIGAHNHEVEVVDGPALAAAGYAVSHRDLNDGTVEGLAHAERPDRIGPVPSGGRARTDRRDARLRPGARGGAGVTPHRARCSSSAPDRSSSVRRPSSTTPACRPAWRCARRASRRSSSTRTRPR